MASDKDEQPGGGVDMAYMVKLENGTIANYTPVYPWWNDSSYKTSFRWS